MIRQLPRETLKLYADRAVGNFINHNIPLNQSILQLAKDNDLNIDQIKRVCEMANILTQGQLYPVDPLMQFDLADWGEIIKQLNSKPDVEATTGETIPFVEKPDLISEFLGKSTNERISPQTRITIIQIRKIAKAIENELKREKYESFKLNKKAESIDLDIRHMVKLAMAEGTYPSLLKAGYDLLDKEGLEYIFNKIAYWKKQKVYCANPKTVPSGKLNKSHPFMQKLAELAKVKKDIRKSAAKQTALSVFKDKIYKYTAEPTKIEKLVNKKPTTKTYKQR